MALEPRKEVLARIRENFPSSLIGQSRWCLWRLVEREGRKTKLPFQPSGKAAESNNRSTWSSFDDVCAAYLKGKFDGVGCFISDGYIGVDFDKVRDPKSGEIQQWALDAIRSLNSYTEISPSQTGLHVWCVGKLPGKGKRAGRVEVYGEGRYFTVTGVRL